MNTKEIDLRNYKNGVTLIIDFIVDSKPFFVVITDLSGTVVFYYRKFDKEKLKLNLPYHSDQVKIWSRGAEVRDYVIMNLQKFNLPYVPNTPLIQERPYSFDEIKIMNVPRFKTPGYENQPAKFYPNLGVLQQNISVMGKFPQPVNAFVTSHEFGHYFYGRPCPKTEILMRMPPDEKKFYMDRLEEDEKECDRFALYKHINDGYNFSGGLVSLVDTLSPHAFNASRMTSLFDEIKKMHKNLDLG